MKKLACLVFIFVLMIPFVFAGGAKDKASGNKIVIYTSMYQDIIDALQKDLSARFPAYNVEFVYGGTGSLRARVTSELASGRLGCDMLLVATSTYALEVKEKGILHPYKSPEASSLAFDYDPDGCWYPVRVSNMVLAYNPEKNARDSVPHSFYDFANDPSVKNAISMNNPLVSGTSMAAVTALRDKYGLDYYKALGRQNVMIDSGAVALQKLESGEAKVAMILEESILKKRQEENSKLEVIYPTDGVVMIPSTIMTINDQWSANRNTKAAEAITDWFLSAEGQDAIVDGWMHSVRTDFPRIPYDSIPTKEILANSMPVNWDFRESEKIQDDFEDYALSTRDINLNPNQ